ncbi:MAG: LPS export ABC transporter periplasmic protein LptC [Steroidobacteraceae bacterium]
MKKSYLLGAVFVILVAGLAAWLAGVGRSSAPVVSAAADSTDSAYDYDARDVVVRQMGPDGSLQYEVEAKQVTQQPRNGRISASNLVMHHDPAGTTAGGPRRWTLTADRADLPEQGDVVSLQGKVRAQGRLEEAQAPVSLVTEQLDYNLTAQSLASDQAVQMTWAGGTIRGRKLRANIKSGDVSLESEVHGTLAP